MEGIIHAFGIDGKLILTQFVNFAILAGVLGYFLYKPILAKLHEREKVIRDGVRNAKDAAKIKIRAEGERDELIAKAEHEARDIVSRGKRYSEERAVELVEEAAQKAQATLNAAEMKKRDIIESAKRESEAEIAKLVILATEKMLIEKSQSK